MPHRVRNKSRPRAKHFVREWRQHRKLTQQQLADAIGTTPATISRIEKGGMPYIQDTLEPIAVALRTTPAALISRRPGENDQDLWLLLQQADEGQRSKITAIVRRLIAPKAGFRETSSLQSPEATLPA